MLNNQTVAGDSLDQLLAGESGVFVAQSPSGQRYKIVPLSTAFNQPPVIQHAARGKRGAEQIPDNWLLTKIGEVSQQQFYAT